MDEKREMQNRLNQSLSGLKEDPFLAQRVIAQGKGEPEMKKKLTGTLVLAVVLILALLGSAYALFSSQVADFFRQYWNRDLGDWLQEGKIARVGDSVTIGDVVFTMDEIVYRDRGVYAVGTARPADERDQLVPMDLADAWDIYSKEAEGQEIIRKAAAAGGRLLETNIMIQEIGVDGGTMLSTEYCGEYNIRNEDGSLTFSLETSGKVLEDGTAYEMQLEVSTRELTADGGRKENSDVYADWFVSFEPVIEAETTSHAETPTVNPEEILQDGYEVIVPDEYRETGTMPFYRAEQNNFTEINFMDFYDMSGIADQETEEDYIYYEFKDHAVMDIGPEYVQYEEYTDELFDYNWKAREMDDPDIEPDWGKKHALSWSIAEVAAFVNWGDDFAKDAVLEKQELSGVTLEQAKENAETMLRQLQVDGFKLSWALDMSLERIRSLGKAYNEYWFEGPGFTNSPRYDYDTATAEDEGYYLIYQGGTPEDEAKFFITSRGIVYMDINCGYRRREATETPERLITPQEAVERLYEEIARSRKGGKVTRINKVELIYLPVRAENKQEGMVFAPVWEVSYADEAGEKKDIESWAQFNAVNGKLIDAIFQ